MIMIMILIIILGVPYLNWISSVYYGGPLRPVVGNENFAVRLCFCQQYAVVIIFASFLSPDTTLVLKQHSAWYVPMIVLIIMD